MLEFRQYHLHQIFDHLLDDSTPLDLILAHYFRQNKALGSKDRKYIGETLYQLMRHKTLLDHFITGEKTWSKRLSIFLEQPLDALAQTQSLQEHEKVSFPKKLFDYLVNDYGLETATKLASASNVRAPITIRVNTLKISRDKFLKKYENDFEMQASQHSPVAIEILKRVPLFQHETFKKGYFEMQDEASQLIAFLVQAKPKDKVLDFCAGSGGKALAIAPSMQNSGVIYLHDIRDGILLQAKKRCKRAGIQNVQFYGSTSKHLKGLKGNMDWVLVDAPCSGSGTYRRNPDLKWKFSDQMLEEVTTKQRSIFEEALNYLKPGGKIVYSTCSFLKKENEDQVNYFLKQHNLKLVDTPFSSVDHFEQMDGFFGAVFQKC